MVPQYLLFFVNPIVFIHQAQTYIETCIDKEKVQCPLDDNNKDSMVHTTVLWLQPIVYNNLLAGYKGYMLESLCHPGPKPTPTNAYSFIASSAHDGVREAFPPPSRRAR